MEQKKILIVDDEQAIIDILAYNLKRAHYAVIIARDGEAAVNLARSESPDLMILDLMLPVLDGIEVFKRVRQTHDIPIIMLTALDAEIDRVVGLELGADDYIAKPFQLGELIARVKALVRRSAGRTSDIVDIGRLRLDTMRMSAVFDGVPVQLSPLEFRLLNYLAHQQDRTVSAGELCEHLYGASDGADANAVEAIVSRLRRKFGAGLILTRRGFGYSLDSSGQ